MKRIAYIELDTHAEIAANFQELMAGAPDFSVDYYFSEKILRLLGVAPSETVFRTSAGGLMPQLSAKDYDLVIIGTAHRYFNVFQRVTERFPTAVIVHNKNFSKLSKVQVLSKIFKENPVYRTKLLLKEGLISLPKVYQQAKKLLVLDPSMADERYVYFPLFYTKFSRQPNDSHTLKIAVPGAVSQKRRDYRHIFSTIQNFTLPTELTLAGRAGQPETTWLEALTPKIKETVSIQCFTEKIPQNEFEKVMQSAHVLWCPVRRETEFFSTKEIYGETKMSGNVGDAIKFSKLAVFPPHYRSALPFILNEEKSVEIQFREIIGYSAANFGAFSREKVQNKLLAIFIELAG